MTSVLIADGLGKPGLEALKTLNGIQLWAYEAISKEELEEKLKTAEILIVRSRTQVDKELLRKAEKLKIVLRAGIGLDNVDVKAATDRGVVVMNAPTGNIVTTAEHALAMMFSMTRNIPQADQLMRQGKWEKKKFQGHELRGKTLGVLGFGNIGKAVAERALGLQMKVIAHDPFLSPESAAKYNVRHVSFDDCLKQADYLTLHLPLLPSTKNLLNLENLLKMKKGSFLINCARGGIVNETDLISVLNQGHLKGAALDVFETEPLPENHPLLQAPGVILTPHLGASTDEAQVQVSLEVAEQIKEYVENKVYKNAINLPNLSFDQLEVLQPYLKLCEKLGAFLANVSLAKNVKSIRLKFEGQITEYSKEILSLAALQGISKVLISPEANYVNSKGFLRERGIRVEEAWDSECADYTSLVSIQIEGEETYQVQGALFGRSEPRLVKLNGYHLDAAIEGDILLIQNIDQPGVIGDLGTSLASLNINIAKMYLSRDKKNSNALVLLQLDSPLSENELTQMKKLKGVFSAVYMKL